MSRPQGTDMSERGYQRLIVRDLLENQNYYAETTTADFDTEFCVNRATLFEFLQNTQPTAYAYVEKTGKRAFIKRIDDEIKKHGIVHVLRKGVKHGGHVIKLFHKQPDSVYNQKTIELYEANLFTVTQELVYSNDPGNKNRLDLVVFLNGLPLLTAELKNAYTYQAVGQAMQQYMYTRSPKDKLLSFRRCLVHFAADTHEVYMTTELKEKPNDVRFFPFNRGLNDGKPQGPFGAGNPEVPGKVKSAYLYEDILSKASLSNLVEKFVTVIEEKNEETNKKEIKQIFPRYHQLKVVRNLLHDCRKNGLGRRYLIQHSAGSGKSNSIAWLAHQLTDLYDDSGETALFDCVVIITDRRNLDEQIRKTVKNFGQVKRIVEAITGLAKDIKALSPGEESVSKTTHMRLALESSKKIITCTVQTFPNVLKAVTATTSKRVGIIIDEAHSSQSGNAAASMNAVFSDLDFSELERDEEGNIPTEDLLNFIIAGKKMLPNASYFAFTATPKNKTLETFGQPHEYRTAEGDLHTEFRAFHTYSMRQAIEEGFILDVLKNYTTYQSWYTVRKSLAESGEEQFELLEANKKIRAYVEGDLRAIRDKTKIMVDHFHESVHKLIGRQARAMVVCRSILTAIKYKDAFDDYLKEIKSPYKAIVAFSGKKKHYATGTELTEAKANDFKDANNDIPRQFKKGNYRFLIVANKYQTGFDEPLLHTMYVDKLLAGVQAVQTLSRLNRSHKLKKGTFVLDFYNKTEDVKAAFKDYYTTTVLSEETDINKLHDQQDTLDNYEIYNEEMLTEFFEKFYAENKRGDLEFLVNRVSSAFAEELSKDEQIDFKAKAKSFYRTYNYLVKIKEHTDPYWEKLALFFKHLIPLLKIESEPDDTNVLELIETDSYRTVMREAKTDIVLDPDLGYVQPIPVEAGGAETEKMFDSLENIIETFNKRMGGDLTEEQVNALANTVPEMAQKETEDVKFILNSDKSNAKTAADELLKKMMTRMMFEQTDVFKKFSNDEVFRRKYQDFFFDFIWSGRDAGSGGAGAQV